MPQMSLKFLSQTQHYQFQYATIGTYHCIFRCLHNQLTFWNGVKINDQVHPNNISFKFMRNVARNSIPHGYPNLQFGFSVAYQNSTQTMIARYCRVIKSFLLGIQEIFVHPVTDVIAPKHVLCND
ncbi:hypothetical protein K501DRAFT_274021 [Backusella circina FSU 941]|nr:hypothetical protein K501DRAFT_274021 [Backusella circina FSU 941]